LLLPIFHSISTAPDMARAAHELCDAIRAALDENDQTNVGAAHAAAAATTTLMVAAIPKESAATAPYVTIHNVALRTEMTDQAVVPTTALYLRADASGRTKGHLLNSVYSDGMTIDKRK
jgi:hypothetical protein